MIGMLVFWGVFVVAAMLFVRGMGAGPEQKK